MQAPGFRMNEREANPNPYIAFIRVLKGKANFDDAESILKAVAAQMKKIMEQRFMFVGTLEEAAFNRVFAGRNWNHGQSIELVLRGPGGRFLPMPYIISVMCHEMAHIEQMNHGPKFQKLMAEIKADVRQAQARGYFGDGFWSDGRRLNDSAKMGAEGLNRDDLPEYVCGVTAGDASKATRPRRRPQSSQLGLVKGEASHLSGRQTEYVRKAGRRNNVDMGSAEGRLDGRREVTKEERAQRQADIDARTEVLVQRGTSLKTAKARAAREWKEQNAWFDEGSTRGKVAKSKTAAEMRAEAAERRLAGLSGPSSIKTEAMADADETKPDIKPDVNSDSDMEDVPDPHIGPDQRKRQIEAETSSNERAQLRDEWEELFTRARPKTTAPLRPKRELSPDTDEEAPAKVAKAAQTKMPRFGKRMVAEEGKKALGLAGTPNGTSVGRPEDKKGPSWRTTPPTPEKKQPKPSSPPPLPKEVQRESKRVEASRDDERPGWGCKVCTYVNIMDHGRCEMCSARPNGELPAV